MDSQLLVTLFCALVLILAHHQYLTLFLVAYSIIRSRESEETANGAALQVVPPVSIRGPRTLWTKVRSNDWWERIVMMEFDDADWRENFRITRASFMKLCQMMERVMEPCQVTVRNPVPLGMRVAMVLYKLGSCGEYRVEANAFGVHKCTVKKMVYLFCHGMVDSGVVQTLIRPPTLEEACTISRRFQRKHSIPQIIGICIFCCLFIIWHHHLRAVSSELAACVITVYGGMSSGVLDPKSL